MHKTKPQQAKMQKKITDSGSSKFLGIFLFYCNVYLMLQREVIMTNY